MILRGAPSARNHSPTRSPVLSCSRAPCSRAPAPRALVLPRPVLSCSRALVLSCSCVYCFVLLLSLGHEATQATTRRERRRDRNCERIRDCAETSVCLRAHASRFAIAIASSLGGRKWCSLRKQHPGPALALGLCPQHSQQRGRPVGVVSAESLEVRPSLKSFKSLDARLRACKGNHLTTQSTIRCWL